MMDCDIKKKKNLVFDFGGFQINIPVRNFLHQGDSSKVCYWTMVSTDGKETILDYIFLSSAYVI